MNRNANRTGANATRTSKNARLLGLALTTAIAGISLSGCATNAAPPAALSASKAETALAKGKFDTAVGHAEAAVLADPRNASYRAMMGAAYLDSGRFDAAITSFDDAMALGDNSPRTALSLSLALTAMGRHREAVALLNDWGREIAASDLGLAYSLAGQPEHGVQVLSDALRGGENTPKVRQNLAYSYALAGRWREARLMAAEDVPAGEVSDRIGEWAQQAHPMAYRARIASLLSVPAAAVDSGQRTDLALANFPSNEQLASEASGYASPVTNARPATAQAQMAQSQMARTQMTAAPAPLPMVARSGAHELPPIGDPVDPSVGINSYAAPNTQAPKNFQSAFAAKAPSGGSLAAVTMDAMRFVQEPAVQTTPARNGVTSAQPARKVAPKAATPIAAQSARAQNHNAADGAHLVQLGSFGSEQGARRAWGIYVKRYPELANHQMVITQAVVRGKNYWRVSAGGYDARSSKAMCGRVDSASSDGCFAWSESRPMPGAVDTGRRFAMK